MSRGIKLGEDHIEALQRALRELIAERSASWEDSLDDDAPDDDADDDDEWVDWVETYEDALDGLERLGIDPYEDPLEWIEFLDPLGGFEPGKGSEGSEESRFLEYLAVTYGARREAS
jgi:hypothetical protein